MVLHDWADWTSVATFFIALIGATVGVYGYVRNRCEIHRKSKHLEQYLRQEKQKKKDRGQRSILEIMRRVGLTEDEIIQVSFRNPHVARRVRLDPDTKLAKELLFEYDERGSKE